MKKTKHVRDPHHWDGLKDPQSIAGKDENTIRRYACRTCGGNIIRKFKPEKEIWVPYVECENGCAPLKLMSATARDLARALDKFEAEEVARNYPNLANKLSVKPGSCPKPKGLYPD